MTLIAALEEKFSISIDTDDIVDFSSFKKGKEILKKYPKFLILYFLINYLLFCHYLNYDRNFYYFYY